MSSATCAETDVRDVRGDEGRDERDERRDVEPARKDLLEHVGELDAPLEAAVAAHARHHAREQQRARARPGRREHKGGRRQRPARLLEQARDLHHRGQEDIVGEQA
jgi:hypothetical protein